jgi:hypothetical protein
MALLTIFPALHDDVGFMMSREMEIFISWGKSLEPASRSLHYLLRNVL